MLKITTKEERARRAAGPPPHVPEDPPPTSDDDALAAIAWLDRRAGAIRLAQGVSQPEAARLAWLELRGHLDGTAKPDPLERLQGPQHTPQGTWVWSDPAAPPLELFDCAIPMAEVGACLKSMGQWNEVAARCKFKTRKSQVWQYRDWRQAAEPETDEDLIAAHDAEVERSEPDPTPTLRLVFKCPTCEDSGKVAPDAFGVGEPWFKYLERLKDVIERCGKNPLIHALPCPACRPEESAAARIRLRNR
jgi:hypothetical protein